MRREECTGVYRSVPGSRRWEGRKAGRKAGRNLGWAGLETDCRLARDWLEPFGASRLELGCWRQWTGDWRQAGPGAALAGNLEKRAVARGRGWAPGTAAASQWFRAVLSGGARLGATGTTSLPAAQVRSRLGHPSEKSLVATWAGTSLGLGICHPCEKGTSERAKSV